MISTGDKTTGEGDTVFSLEVRERKAVMGSHPSAQTSGPTAPAPQPEAMLAAEGGRGASGPQTRGFPIPKRTSVHYGEEVWEEGGELFPP